MANPEHLAILKQGVSVWNEWREEHKDVRPDLRQIALIDAVLVEANLSNTHLEGSDLRGARLHSAILREAKLMGAQLDSAVMQNADLRITEFTQADLRRADLRAADLHFAVFDEAVLRGTLLTDTILVEAILTNTDLSDADLSDADLSGADLTRAILSRAKLHHTHMGKIICSKTVFGGLDLSGAKGLETAQHRGPSHIDVATLYNSGGQIPEVFLRGCGIPEIMIEYLPYMTNQAIQFYSCFISYSHADKFFARRLHDTLQGRGIRCWLDEKQMNPGDDIYAEVDQGIKYWDKVLLCCSKSALTEKWWVDMEINKAFQKERELMKDRQQKVLSLIPLDLDGHLFSADYNDPKKDEIHRRLSADFKGWEHDNAIFEREVERVIKALRTDGGKEPLPKRKL